MKHWITLITILSLAGSALAVTEHHGLVRFGEVPVPGAVVRVTQGDKTVKSVTDPDGVYSIPDIDSGTWTMEVQAPGFELIHRDVVIASDSAPAQWDLKMMPLSGLKSEATAGFSSAASTPPLLQSVAADSASSNETASRLLINGSVSNGASTPFALASGFGNNRPKGIPLYSTNILLNGNSSLFDARSFSLTGQNTPKPDYNRMQGTITFGGPFQIPYLFRNGMFSVSYSRTQNRNASLQTVQMPTEAERRGDFSQSLAPVADPTTGIPFAGNTIPDSRISPQARALLNLYPLPNFGGTGRYNYQVPLVGVAHGDNVQATINNITIDNANRLSINVALQSNRSDNPDLFGFTDTGNNRSLTAALTWNHRFTQRISGTIRYAFSRTVTGTQPHFGNRQDVSGDAGIAGNDRDPRNWGPPSLNFTGGIARLSSGSYAFDRNTSSSASYFSNWIKGRHALGYGIDFRMQQFNLMSQQNARGSFTFNRAATGNDFADFLLSMPTTSTIAFGNADKYLRQSFYNAYLTDDFQLKPSITLNLGMRWEYESPITEKYGRLVNLDIAPGFTSAAPVIAGTSSESLIRPDKKGFEPRIGLVWRPRASGSLVVRAGYGMYRDTSVYRSIADQMAQQSPLSKSLSVQSTAQNPLSLADGFRGSLSVTATTFAVDPQFRVGNAQNLQLSLQQDLPSSMQMTLTYLGIKGTHVPQRILPNTFPAGALNPCAGCPLGFMYLASKGSSIRHSGTIEVRRRQRNGFEASARYTFAKAIDDVGIGGNHVAQNWLDPGSERGLSDFDQRHQAVIQTQYTTGMLAGVGTFWEGWRGQILKEWTLTSQLTVSTGSPLTPTILGPVQGTGMSGSLRPNATGASPYISASGAFLNLLAFAAPAPGEWGNAGRNSITGPGQFGLNASLTRTFHLRERISMGLRVDATNVLNHVTFPNWNTIVNSAQFGLPSSANAMRTVRPSLRLRF